MGHCCCSMTPQQRHAALSKVIIFLCTALLVHMVTVAHVHKHEQHDMDRVLLDQPMQNGEAKKKSHSHSFSLSLGCSNSHSHAKDIAPKTDDIETVDLVAVAEGQDKNGNTVVEFSEEVAMRKMPLRAAEIPLSHPNNKHGCLMMLAARISLIAGLIAGFCGRPRSIRFWMATIVVSAVVGTTIAIHHAARVNTGVPHRHLAGHVGAILFTHLVALAVAKRFLYLSRATFETPVPSAEVVGIAMEEAPAEKCAA